MLSPQGVPASYLYLWTTSDEFVDYLTNNAEGSAYPAVLPERFAEATLLVPPNNVLDEFDKIAAPIRCKIAANERENTSLSTIRDTLLPRLISGEVRVRDAEIMGTAL